MVGGAGEKEVKTDRAMKRILVIIGLVLLMGCVEKEENEIEVADPFPYIFRVTTIEGCEYIIIHGGNRAGITHKGNCKNHGQ